jgi:hypothetical protein
VFANRYPFPLIHQVQFECREAWYFEIRILLSDDDSLTTTGANNSEHMWCDNSRIRLIQARFRTTPNYRETLTPPSHGGGHELLSTRAEGRGCSRSILTVTSACTKMRDKEPSPPVVQDGGKRVVVPNTLTHRVPKGYSESFCHYPFGTFGTPSVCASGECTRPSQSYTTTRGDRSSPSPSLMLRPSECINILLIYLLSASIISV